MISTHVLDTSIGRPATGIRVILESEDDGVWHRQADCVTDAEGRARDLMPGDAPRRAGRYRLTFDVAAYFAGRGVEGFFPSVIIVFDVRDTAQHHHVPLLLSPFGYSTYRGS
jgi:5-hydroxyisourate hydrolase